VSANEEIRQTILLADDSSTIQRLVTNTFAGTRFDIVTVSNGEAAIRKFEDLRPAAVLADIYMPGKNGFEVCTHIRAHPLRRDTPVILLVGAFDAFDESNARDAGASAHIKKPFEPQALIEMVNSLFITRQQAEETHVKESHAERNHAVAPSTDGPAATSEIPAAKAAVLDVPVSVPASDVDLLGLEELFHAKAEPVTATSWTLREEDLEKIADRVIQKLSSPVIESIAWDVVPDIATRVIREELKRTHEG